MQNTLHSLLCRSAHTFLGNYIGIFERKHKDKHLLQYMTMHTLPDELIRYIYSFDDNHHFRQLYRNCMHELICIYHKDQVSMHIQHIFRIFTIYSEFIFFAHSFHFYFFRRMLHCLRTVRSNVYIPRGIRIPDACNLYSYRMHKN